MKILYGVQATGNGHLNRCREMAKHFHSLGIDVDYLISGRDRNHLHDMEIFGEYRHCSGLSFASKQGKIDLLNTAKQLKPIQFIQDVLALDLSPYSIIITDFEPVTAWAAKLQNRKCLGIGHQYGLTDGVPKMNGHYFSNWLLNGFAPATCQIGLHWNNFNPYILPPIVDPALKSNPLAISSKIVVYLPFEDQKFVSSVLSQIDNYDFYQYGPQLTNNTTGNIHFRPPSVEGFHRDLENCSGVICNSGFELISECQQMGIPVLTTPLAGQLEQESNALTLQQLQLASVTDYLDKELVVNWLQTKHTATPRKFPDVAKAIAEWVSFGCKESIPELAKSLWKNCQLGPLNSFENTDDNTLLSKHP